VGDSLELGLLGPFQVRIDGGPPLPLGGLRQRALLALLALHANEVVSKDRLIDGLWGEHAPAKAGHTVQVFVSRLRSALGGAGERLLTRPPGYVLELGMDELDSARCEQLYEAGRSALAGGDAAGAAALLGEAQALWRGPPLADFTYEPFAQAAIARLEELRVSCREELIEAGLILGRHAELVADLEALVREQPFRERPRGQLMLALYRCGRQADALEEFQRARRMLVEQLAVEPGAALRELEQAILRQDESLELPAAGASAALDPSADAGPTKEDQGEAARSDAPFEVMVRRTATILVGRLSTAAPADPETARRSMAAARERAEEIVSRHGGAFVGALGGELVWVFGVPLVREDDVLRALRAADELRGQLTGWPEPAPHGLTVRIGLATGEVVAETVSDVFGEPLNRGLGLTQLAEAGEILLADATRQLAAASIRVEPTSDARTWRLIDLVDDSVPDVWLEVPMIARDQELETAVEAFERAASSGEAHLLTVLGDPGIGKSRFARELCNQLADRGMVLSGRCLSYGEGIALWPLREALMQAAGAESREGLRALLDDAEDADVVADTIAMRFGLIPAQSVAEQVPWAFRRLLEVRASSDPLLLVIEDAHWADDELIDLIDYLIDWLKAPVLVLCLARPELLEAKPAWGGGWPRVSSITLTPLRGEDALGLLEAKMGDRQLSPVQTARIVEAAEGNPLFVEQLLQASAEDPSWDPTAEIPGTIQSVLAARLDRLGPGERAFIERAAVIGREFWPDAVVELLPEQARASAAQHLRSLVHRGLIQPGRSSLAGEEQLRFHHILIRDVAYLSTPKALRSELHEQFGEWLARRPARYDEFIGYHFEQAFRYRKELGKSGAGALAERAADHFASAGARAMGRGDANNAIDLLSFARDLYDAAGVERPEVLIDLGIALDDNGEFERAKHVLMTAQTQAAVAKAEGLRARAEIELSYRRAMVEAGALVQEIEPVARRAIQVFTSLGDDEGLSRAWRLIAEVKWQQCRCAESEALLERALKHADRTDDHRERPGILTRLATITATGPRPVEAGIARCKAILERAEESVKVIAIVDTLLAYLEATQGRFEEARRRWRRSEHRLEDVGLSFDRAALHMYLAFIELMAGSPERARPAVTEAYEFLKRAGARNRLATVAASLGRIEYQLEHYEEAAQFCRVARDSSSEDDVASQVLWRGTQSKILARMGQVPKAATLADSAVALAADTDLLITRGDSLVDRAEVLRLLGKHGDAARDLSDAIALYRAKGSRVSVDSAQRLLDTVVAAQLAASVSSDVSL
jgi:DNA-binding SARP family transcriptional activator/tetratricopeptide (TPR) repeat protein